MFLIGVESATKSVPPSQSQLSRETGRDGGQSARWVYSWGITKFIASYFTLYTSRVNEYTTVRVLIDVLTVTIITPQPKILRHSTYTVVSD